MRELVGLDGVNCDIGAILLMQTGVNRCNLRIEV